MKSFDEVITVLLPMVMVLICYTIGLNDRQVIAIVACFTGMLNRRLIRLERLNK
jgi:hypothetical protein